MKNFSRELFPDVLEGKKVAYNPTFVARRYTKSCSIYGEELVFKSRRFQKAREMFAAAGFLYAYSGLTEKSFTLSPVYDDTTPDIYGYYEVPSEKIVGEKNRIRMNIEVTDWEGHTADTLYERIIKKLANKAYPKNYILLVVASREGQRSDLYEEVQKLKKEKLSVKTVWVIGALKNDVKETFQIINVYDINVESGFSFEFSVYDFLHVQREPYDFVYMLKGRGGSSHVTDNYRLPYPSLSSGCVENHPATHSNREF